MPHTTGARALPLLAVALTALNLRTAVTGFTPLLDVVGADLGFGPGLYGVLGTTVTAGFAVLGLLSAPLVRRTGLERAVAVAVALTTAGVTLRALSPGTAALVASTVVAVAGIGLSNVLVIPLVKRYFSDHLKAVSSLYIALLQVGQFVAPLLALPVAVAAGWRWAVGLWAVPTGVAVVLWVVVAARAARTDRADAAGPTTTAVPAPARLEGAWRTPLLWSLVLMMGMTSLNVHAIFTWLPSVLVDAGADPASGGALLALFSVLGLPAAFVVPPLAIRLRNPFPVVAVCTALMAVGYVGLLVAPAAGAVAWVVALGLGVSTFPLCLTLVNARTRTTTGSTVLSGAMQGLGYAVASIGPLGVGLLRTTTDGWGAPFAVLFVSLAVLLGAGVVACRPSVLEDQVRRPALVDA
ncbi:MFS transporter [Pseudokineococcus lusitanus]|uniref:CP family cyanate transporter-like MFS transporter n=1 Tax=Pseudokineococcus lusitanus TaxID=763993 RepID=A0A3N1GWU0_9ACTN|nr:MFS transporter [Pseudokineococcus lusitanus]ROP34741.1 CP family cyanate transporter-like MFS transporter [Pseudokineococcus lusitanus]